MATGGKASDADIVHMRHALALARRGLGQVAPNPAVGCVIVREGRVIGRGWTQPGGRPHAETVALGAAGGLARGATAYVSLEPCAHHGKTPPCADALVAAGISRLVYAVRDPDPRVDGGGHRRLAEAGIEVVEGVCAEEAAALNFGFFVRVKEGRPAVTLKLATSLDGMVALANGRSQWITGSGARALSHLMRAEHDAILTGIGTVMADDPALTCRLPGLETRSPHRVVLDAGLRMPVDRQLVETAGAHPTIVFTAAAPDDLRAAALVARGVEIEAGLPVDGEGRLVVGEVLRRLAGRGLNRVMVEAGGELSTSFLKAELVDELVWFRAPALIGGDGRPAVRDLGIELIELLPRFRRMSVRQIGEDVLETYRPRN